MVDHARSKILVADDIKSNINILIKVLKEEYDLSYVQDGESVLEYVSKNPVDLILLDILMPGLDGYQVCQALKENEATVDIPVIFITSKSRDEDETKGFELGAIDYITKPFSFPIVKARVRTHLALKNALRDLKYQNEALLENTQLREDVERVTRHDLKSPLVSIIGYSEFGLLKTDLDHTVQDCLETIRDSGYKMLEMINLSLDLVKMERGSYLLDPSPVDLLAVIRKILKDFIDLTRGKTLAAQIYIGDRLSRESDTFIVQSEELLCYSMFSNLLKNAIEASPFERTITVYLSKEEFHTISIHNMGVVPEEIRDSFFEKYSTAGKKNGTGLGTYSAKLIIETHGGSIDYESSEEYGTTIISQLPKFVGG